jgi:DNA-binding NarL/FixJ family response regulator
MEGKHGMKRPRLLLADDHTLMLEGIRRILGAQVELVGTARNGRELLKLAEQTRPDVVLLDIAMPLLNGIDAARQIKKLLPATKLIFLTMHADRDYVIEAFRAGASGYLVKWSAEDEVAVAIRSVLSGRRYITSVLPQEIGTIPKRNTGELSSREREVLQLVAEGRTAKEIASILHLSSKTVEYHKYRMMKRLGVHTAIELAKYAVQRQALGLSPPRSELISARFHSGKSRNFPSGT